ncbi:hypothetical protein UK23_23250 [Lentzea aerocolonigenes]|uniref:Uncharacterized protein n=1 Tax=Lentzea aerocolonigenes TaxID=68170 RepID=A0A0F0GVD6_LENAE|nr:hypothetical protein UK23_23250 [Lentzea aerocolonigenes]
MSDCVAFDQDITTMSVELRANGLEARRGVELLDHDGFARFLEQLAADFLGWDDRRAWRSYDEEFAVTARFHSRGRVELQWTLADTVSHAWTAAVTTWLHAGEDMARLAADARELFDAR